MVIFVRFRGFQILGQAANMQNCDDWWLMKVLFYVSNHIMVILHLIKHQTCLQEMLPYWNWSITSVA